MKIVYTVNDPLFFLSHRLPLAKNAINKNWQVYLISDFSHAKKEDFTNHNIEIIHIPLSRTSTSVFKNINSFFKLLKSIKKISPDIIHNITLKMSLLGSLCLFFGVNHKIINAISGLGYLYTNSRISISKFLVSFMFKTINTLKKPVFIFQNNYDLEVFERFGVKNNFVLIKGSGVNKDEFDYFPQKATKKVNITFTGRILKDKGVIDLIKAIELLPEHIKSNITVNLFGKIDTENPAHIDQDELQMLLIPGLILWHGHSDNIKKNLIDSDIYCFPSYREGLPKSTIEAMAIGRPILTTTAPGCDDTVQEGFNGYKVKVGDSTGLSKKIQELIENKELRIQMGKNSRELFLKNFTLEKVVSQTFDLYDKLIVNKI